MIIIRTRYEKEYTLGYLITDHDTVYRTLELPWKDNKKNISCIPTGEYKARKRTSKKHGEHISINYVPNRSYILIHPANFVKELEGCIAVGLSHGDIDGDGKIDVISSKAAMELILKDCEDTFNLSIV